MIYLGLDPGYAKPSWLCELTEGGYRLVELPDLRDLLAYDVPCEEIRAWIEVPEFNRRVRPQGLLHLGVRAGELRGVLLGMGVQAELVPPKQWKCAHFRGGDRMKKEVFCARLSRDYRLQGSWNDDQIDAFGIAKALEIQHSR